MTSQEVKARAVNKRNKTKMAFLDISSSKTRFFYLTNERETEKVTPVIDKMNHT